MHVGESQSGLFLSFLLIYELRQRSNAKQDAKIYHPDGMLTVSDNRLMSSKYNGKLSILVLRVCMLPFFNYTYYS